jgi:peptidoglycan-associated lipoprotein
MIRVALSISIAAAVVTGCAHEAEAPKRVSAAAPQPVAISKPAPPLPKSAAPAEVTEKPEDTAIYFDFDSSLVRDDARPVLQKVGAELKRAGESLRVEGNCDEVGTVEYNLALGEARARAAKDYLVHLGVPAHRIGIESYGSQRPKYPGHDDDAHAKNRRDDLVIR